MRETNIQIRCHVSASESSSNWFHACLYHIVNESTRRNTAVSSDSRGQTCEEEYSTSAWISPGKGFLCRSPRFLSPRLCVYDPCDTCVMPNASRGSVCLHLPFFSITFCHFHNDSLYWRRFPTSVNTCHHNFPWAFHQKTGLIVGGVILLSRQIRRRINGVCII